MSDRPEWFADEEGNLSHGENLTPDTDEFGRDDPESIERERRRREREAGRKGAPGKEPGGAGGGRRARGRKPRASLGRTGPDGGSPEQGVDPTQVMPAVPEPSDGAVGPGKSKAGAAGAAGGRMLEGIRKRMPARPGGSGGGSFTRRRIAALAGTIVAVLALWFGIALLQPFAGKGLGDGQVIVNIPEGASASEVANILSSQGVVSAGGLFELRLRFSGKTDEILPGRYVLASGMSYGTAIERLTGSPEGLVTLTIPEGLPRTSAAELVRDAGVEGDYVAATKSFEGFDPAKYGASNPPTLEGFLFPATYKLQPGSSVQELVSQQLDAFEQNLAEVNRSFAKSKNLTPYDVLIIASMVDREVMVPSERRLVAAVIYNRLARREPLGIDATTRYEYGIYDKQLTNAQLRADTPYNTRLNAGLPPTPIGNPGLAAIRAAARPAKVNFLYFVVKPGTCGEHSFTASEAEFERLAADYQRALEAAGGSPTTCP